MLGYAAALLVGIGLAIVVVALLRRAHVRQNHLLELLGMPYAEEDLDHEELVRRVGLLTPGVDAVDHLLQRAGFGEGLAHRLERARVLLRPAEYGLAVAFGGLAAATWVAVLSGRWFLGVLVLLFAPFLGVGYLDRRIRKRRRAFEEQLPATLTMLASSLRSGHTLLRAFELHVQEGREPMASEFERVLAETRLGTPLVDALDNLAERIELRDLEYVVHAVRIQQTTGGKLADLLFTLADYMRARQEVRREVQVLTAEGRLSAYVLAGMPFLLAIYMSTTNPAYFADLLTPLGLAMLAGAGVLLGIGLFIIRAMVKGVDL
jgi:tight adherence protein B